MIYILTERPVVLSNDIFKHVTGHSLLQCQVQTLTSVSVLLSPPVLASNSLGEEILATHRLMGHLNPGTFSDFWQIVARHRWQGPDLHIIAKTGRCDQES